MCLEDKVIMLSIADRMSQQCRVLSHRLRIIEPVNEEKGATIKKTVRYALGSVYLVVRHH